MNVNFYKIVCNNTGAIYVGSTVKTMQKRLQKHEYDYIRYLNGKFNFITSFIILENKNYSIELIDTVVCTDRKNRDTLERLHILNEDCVNKYQPGRDIKQYREDNKEQTREYYQNNKEKLKEYAKQYREDNKEYAKQYREDNKEKLKEKFNCLCGGSYVLNSKARHLKTKLHIDYLATL